MSVEELEDKVVDEERVMSQALPKFEDETR